MGDKGWKVVPVPGACGAPWLNHAGRGVLYLGLCPSLRETTQEAVPLESRPRSASLPSSSSLGTGKGALCPKEWAILTQVKNASQTAEPAVDIAPVIQAGENGVCRQLA